MQSPLGLRTSQGLRMVAQKVLQRCAFLPRVTQRSPGLGQTQASFFVQRPARLLLERPLKQRPRPRRIAQPVDVQHAGRHASDIRRIAAGIAIQHLLIDRCGVGKAPLSATLAGALQQIAGIRCLAISTGSRAAAGLACAR